METSFLICLVIDVGVSGGYQLQPLHVVSLCVLISCIMTAKFKEWASWKGGLLRTIISRGLPVKCVEFCDPENHMTSLFYWLKKPQITWYSKRQPIDHNSWCKDCQRIWRPYFRITGVTLLEYIDLSYIPFFLIPGIQYLSK